MTSTRSKRIKTILGYLITFLLLITINFSLPRLMPGDPFIHAGGEAGEVITFYSEDQIEYLREYYGLDEPVHRQYFSYLGDTLTGNLGFSYYYNQDVSQIILKRLPWTMLLVIFSTALSIILGIILGSYSAEKRGGWQDRAVYLVMIVFSEIPAFLIGIFLLVILGASLGLFPLSGGVTHFTVHESIWSQIIDILYHSALPIMTLTLSRVGGMYLLVRNSMTTVLSKDYIKTAKAKGLKKFRIKYVHGLRNAILPLITRVCLQMGGIIGGAVLAENVFSYPGLGTIMTEAVFVRDYPLLQGIFLVMALTVMGANVLADVLYQRLDPRTKAPVINPKKTSVCETTAEKEFN
ncbi:ABC transporter permease [Natranaerofaba carboxydovora]|uniref:ABC transporter permease n=1 Tax=Natranaerofaba carboxydovora TaxID=2742683 RepID=UPI001F132AC5|nr:ABC transporter permease [Natranaerofaba carboxydovora]UMZ73442.1 Glutathione transport system permease protein GsiC [Natranaerofaba carboxydovora]